MGTVRVGTENTSTIGIHYEDYGSGRPVVLIHGFPLNGASWEKQVPDLVAAGNRVITYDRRGFGASSQPWGGYDYDTFAADLNALLTTLDLGDVALVGFSMGSGEVTRYLGTYGSERVRAAALLAPIPPFLLKTADNPAGVDGDVFEGFKAAILADRPAYLTHFFHDFNNVDVFGGTRISDDALGAEFTVAVGASPHATWACVDSWLTDFRADLPRFDVPTLVMQGTADRILPYAATSEQLKPLLPDAEFIAIADGPHNIAWTHAEQVTPALVEFVGR